MKTLSDRFHEKFTVNDSSGCWEWTATRSTKGYGMIGQGAPRSTLISAHRVAFELYVGPVPDGLQLDHLCRVRHCVNPAHLEPVSPRENTRRGLGVGGINAAKTHCSRGHEYSEANTYLWPSGNRRGCRICIRMHENKRYGKGLVKDG